MSYRTLTPIKFNGIRYKEHALIPDNEFTNCLPLLDKMINSGLIEETKAKLSKKEAQEFNEAATVVEENKLPDIGSMTAKNAIECVQDYRVVATLFRFQAQENHREGGGRVTVIRALERQISANS